MNFTELHKVLIAAGYVAQMNESLMLFLRAQGRNESLNEALYLYLDSLGYGGSLSEKLYLWFLTGYTLGVFVEDLFLDYTVTADVTAPVLSSPTGAKDGPTTYTGSVTTTEANGALYWVVQLASTATPTANQIKLGLDGTGAPAVEGVHIQVATAGTHNIAGSGLTDGVDYEIAYYQTDNAGNGSNIVVCSAFGAADTVAPVLTAPTGAKSGATTYTGTVDTDEANGTLKWIVQATAVATPSAAQIAAGLDGSGASAVHSGSQAVSATGTQNISGSGLTNGVGYEIAYYHDDAAGNDSNVVVTTPFGASSSGIILEATLQTNHAGTSTKTVDLTSMSLPDDCFVVIDYYSGSNAFVTLGVDASSSGWTKIANVSPGTGTYRSSMSRSYKQMVGAADSSVVMTGLGGSTRNGIIFIRAYSGVDGTTPWDVTYVSNTSSSTPLVNPASITPTTSGALIIVGGVGATETANTAEFNAPSDLTDWIHDIRTSGTTADMVAGMGHKAWTSGAFDGEAWTGPNAPANSTYSCIVSVLRPA